MVNIPEQLSRNFILGEVLARNARTIPHKLCVWEGEREYTYREFNLTVNKLANALAGLGVGAGDKVAVLLFNTAEILQAYFALAKLRAVAVPVNFRLAGPEIQYIVDNSDAKIFIYDGMFDSAISGIAANLPGVEKFIAVAQDSQVPGALIYSQVLAGGGEEEIQVLVADDDDAFIVYTSGTTGKPKGAVLTHKNVLGNALSCLVDIATTRESRYLCVPPLFHVASLAMTIQNIYMGASIYLLKVFDPKTVLEIMEREKITSIFLVPAMWNFILQVPDLAKYNLESLNVAITGAAIMPLNIKKRLLKVFTGLRLYDAFGQTEMSPVTTLLLPGDTLRKPTSVGRPIMNTEIKVLNNEGAEVAIGEVGEIVYRGWGMFKCYYKNPGATADAFTEGWFHSGDLVRLDDEGFVYVVDRKKDMLITGGENVYPAEVEEVLYKHEKVLEAAVIGKSNEGWGEAVHAVVVPKPGAELTQEEIIAFCGQQLAGYKKPRSVEFMEALPRNAAGKVLKTRLRENLSAK